MNWVLALLIWVVISLLAGAGFAFVMTRHNTRRMRTADEKQIDRETAAIQRNARSTSSAPHIVETPNVRSLCKERARQAGRHAARIEDITGQKAVNPYRANDPGYVEFAIAMAEMHQQMAEERCPFNQFNH